MKKKNLLKGYIYVILSAVMFGLMPLMAKLAYKEGVTSAGLAFFRNLLSLPFIWMVARLTKSSLKIKADALPSIFFISTGACLTSLLLYGSYSYIPSGAATVLHFVYPAAVVLGEFLFFKNKLTKSQLISVIICVVGIALFYNPENKLNFKGSMFALLSGVAYAAYIIGLSLFKYKDMPSFSFSFYLFSAMSVLLFIICIFTHQLTFPVTVRGWVITIVFAITFNVAAAVLFQKGTFLIGGGRASILSTLEPVVSVLAGIAFFDEKAGLFTVIGTLLVIFASVLIASNDIKNPN